MEAEVLRLIDRALSSTDQAMHCEESAAAAAGKAAPSTGAVWMQGWARHRGLEEVVGAIRRFLLDSFAADEERQHPPKRSTRAGRRRCGVTRDGHREHFLDSGMTR